MTDRFDRRDVLVALVVAAFAIILYRPLTLDGRVLASYDSLVYFYPNAVYLADRLREGQIPLWNPYLFAGVPFLANSQAGVFYPFNLLYLIGPVSRIYAYLVVGHVWLLTLGFYILGRWCLRLSRMGALFAALAIGFGGFVGGMNGHLNQLETLAWAPFAIATLERGAALRSWRWSIISALVFAVAAFAGHSQELYMTGVVAGFAALGRLVEHWWPEVGRTGWRTLVPQVMSDIARMATGPFLGICLAAAQLLPTLELTGVSIRAAGTSFIDGAAFSLPPPLALVTLLPTINQPLVTTEWLGYLGVSTIVLAVIGLWRRPSREAWWLGGLAVVGLFLAFGKYTPIFQIAFDFIPGVKLYRVPARWLTLWVIGVGMLAGWGLDVVLGLGRAKSTDMETAGVTLATFLSPIEWQRWFGQRQRTGWRTVDRLIVVGYVLTFGAVAALAYHDRAYRHLIEWPQVGTLTLWGAALVGSIVFLWFAKRGEWAGFGLIAVLLGEMLVAAGALPFHEAVWIQAVESYRAPTAFMLNQHSNDRVLGIGDNSFDPGDINQLRAMLAGTLPLIAQQDYITAIKHVEGLTPNLPMRFGFRALDGYDGGVLPLIRFNELKKLFPVQGPVVDDGRLRLQLKSAPDPRLLGWLNVRWLVMDRLRDQWIDNVYYDLSVTQVLAPNTPLTLAVSPSFAATSFGVFARGATSSLPEGTLTIQAGAAAETVSMGATAPPLQTLKTDTDPMPLGLWRSSFKAPTTIDRLTLTWQGNAPLVLRGLSLINQGNGSNQVVVVSPAYQIEFLGDVKIYENRDTLPRAFLADGLAIANGPGGVVDQLKNPTWQAQDVAVSAAGDGPGGVAPFQESGPPGEVKVVVDRPEEISLMTDAAGPRMLVLTDSYYPGWTVTVDGVSQPILPVDILFRGVHLAPGAHQVIFRYQPESWRLGLLLSALGGLGTVGGLIVSRR